MIDDSDKIQALESGVVTLTGGRSRSGSFIINFPTNKLEELPTWSTEKLASLILHVSAITKYLKPSRNDIAVSQNLALVCLADLRQASTLALKQLTESLESVEHQQRGTVGAVYFIKPRSKTRSHILKKLLGVKPSKKRPKVPLFKVVLMKAVHELQVYIDVTQLTADFCGILRYNHTSWIHLYNVVIRCIEGCQDLLTKLPGVKDKIDLLQEYETDGQTSNQVQQLLADLTEKFHIIISQSSLQLHHTMSKQTLFLLDHPSSDNNLSLVHPELISGLRSYLRGTYSELDRWNTDLEDAWRATESRLTVLIQVHRHRERAKEIERKICEHYHPLLHEHPIVGKTLSQAELYRAHFTTTLYDPAKELLSQATEILEAVQRLKNDSATKPTSGRHDSTTTHSGSGIISDQDISDISQCLTTSIQPFTTQLQQLQQLYVSIHIFHLLFEKALIWYKKVLKFIPESLLQRCSTGNPSLSVPNLYQYSVSAQTKECLVHMPPEWLGAVRAFLSRHPPPRQEHIERLDENIPQLVDRKMRSQARSLALRLQLLQRILTSTRLPLKVVTAVLTWKAELFGQSQQEKMTGVHHVSNQMKVPTNQENQGSDKMAVRDPSRPHSRAPEKPPRNKKLSSFDAHIRRASSSHLLPFTGGQQASLEVNLPERPTLRKSSSKMFSRSKSVEFNFNSSSTDGSVFDYDKALLQAETAGSATKTKTLPQKPRTSIRESKTPYASQPLDLKSVGKDDHAFSDPSGLIDCESRSSYQDRVSGTALKHQKRNYKSDPANDESKCSVRNHNYTQRRSMYEFYTTTEPDQASCVSVSYNNKSSPRNEQPQENVRTETTEQKAVLPNSDERFIRVTLTPKQSSVNTKPVFLFNGEDLSEATGSYKADEEEESGIDVTHGVDPYDTVVNKIREISASNLTNIEKLKQVSQLLSLSTLKRDSSQKSTASRKQLSKMSFSTLDLRTTHQDDRNRNVIDLKDDSPKFYDNSIKGERPLETVLRMKKNLAKSMEELNLPISFTQNINANSSEYNHTLSSGSHDDVRCKSEVGGQSQASKTVTATEGIGSQNISSSHEKELPQYLSYKGQEHKGSQSLSDVESLSQGRSASLSYHDQLSHSKQSPSPYLDSPSNSSNGGLSKTVVSRFIPDDTAPNMYPMEAVVLGEHRKLPTPRPASLSLFTSRNFISPSFLRPATSMVDLSTRSCPEVTFDMEVDLEQDYQTLEDFNLLQTMQEDPLSSEPFTSRTQKTHFYNHMPVKPRDAQRRREVLDQSETYSSRKKTYQDVSGQSIQSLSGVRVGHLTESSSRTGKHCPTTDTNYERLTMEADRERQSQEEVAKSLRKTQKILEEEEHRMFQKIHNMSDPSLEEDEGAAGGLSRTTSLDNGYGSWASKFMRSTSSEGPGHGREWRKLSTSSSDCSFKLPKKTEVMDTKTPVKEDDLEASDAVHELPWIDKPLTDPDLY